MLPTIASLIDEGPGREHYATLLEARPKPYVLDDATIERTKRVNREGLEWCNVYDRQLLRWRSQRLTDVQRREIARLEDVQRIGGWCSHGYLSSLMSSGRRRSSDSSPRATSRSVSSTCCASLPGLDVSGGLGRWRRLSGRRTRGFGAW